MNVLERGEGYAVSTLFFKEIGYKGTAGWGWPVVRQAALRLNFLRQLDGDKRHRYLPRPSVRANPSPKRFRGTCPARWGRSDAKSALLSSEAMCQVLGQKLQAMGRRKSTSWTAIAKAERQNGRGVGLSSETSTSELRKIAGLVYLLKRQSSGLDPDFAPRRMNGQK
ncbi:hypothetical protein B0H14DRAFT_2597912 [Mycena olivaceomarginata]|nr:hypothetical protein B0H14DRAFT_2597912 [Mycena olivaceomarginata]